LLDIFQTHTSNEGSQRGMGLLRRRGGRYQGRSYTDTKRLLPKGPNIRTNQVLEEKKKGSSSSPKKRIIVNKKKVKRSGTKKKKEKKGRKKNTTRKKKKKEEKSGGKEHNWVMGESN